VLAKIQSITTRLCTIKGDINIEQFPHETTCNTLQFLLWLDLHYLLDLRQKVTGSMQVQHHHTSDFTIAADCHIHNVQFWLQK
jgi:hypothetical protein